MDGNPGNVLIARGNLWFIDPDPSVSANLSSNILIVATSIMRAGSEAGGIDKETRIAALQRYADQVAIVLPNEPALARQLQYYIHVASFTGP